MRQRRVLIALMLALGLVASACGSTDVVDETTTLPVETTTTVAEATTTVAETTTTVAPFDLLGAVDSFSSSLPEGWLVVGDVQAFKDAVAASGAFLLDVREAGEYAEGHIEGAVNVPLRTLAQNLDKVPTDRQVFVYCKSGHRAAMALASLQMLGYDNVLSFKPGWNGWTEAGEEVSTDAVEGESYPLPEIHPELLASVEGFLSTIPEGWLYMGDLQKFKDAAAAGAVLIDLRTPEEYAKGYIGEAININIRGLVADLSQIPTDKQVIVYCGSGHRSAMAVVLLHMAGYDNVLGGPSVKAWTAANEPLTTP